MSFSFGLAIFLLVLFAAYRMTGRPLGDYVVRRLKNLLGVFVAGVLYFVLVYHLANLYATEHHGVETFVLTRRRYLHHPVLGRADPAGIARPAGDPLPSRHG